MSAPISPHTSPDITIAALAVHFVVSLGLMGICLFGTAGTLLWLEAWAWLAMQFASSMLMTVWMWRHDPALLKSRTQLFTPGIQGRDQLFMVILGLLFIPYLLIPGLDAVRYGWSEIPIPLEVAGLLGAACSMGLILRVMQVNSFASPTIEVQKERGHAVVDTGPYAIVRHPMYSGCAIYLCCVPLAWDHGGCCCPDC
ncbi:MAG: isoprenylcysteine carboxyl methyltransferase [Zetaproteobacteria bacterium CG03_land_8_20_14_0_80_59_51]|nr:MAG: isoprenylcysteine carboxyl methyltransferase [Zetaproteobacteria bacterium CG03_land_8_20_14_0_80_59_51]